MARLIVPSVSFWSWNNSRIALFQLIWSKCTFDWGPGKTTWVFTTGRILSATGSCQRILCEVAMVSDLIRNQGSYKLEFSQLIQNERLHLAIFRCLWKTEIFSLEHADSLTSVHKEGLCDTQKPHGAYTRCMSIIVLLPGLMRVEIT